MNKNDYYIYVHHRVDNGEVFYVGKGRGRRCFITTSRNKKWHNIVKEANGFTVEYLHNNLLNDEALAIESEYLSKPKPDWNLINISKVSKIKPIVYGYFSDIFYIDESSPSCLRYLKEIRGGHYKTQVIKRGGAIAGTLNDAGYWEVRLNKIKYRVHRIIYCLAYMKDLDTNLVIDHKDSNKSNNKVDNLQEISQRDNAIKQRIRNTNTSGFIGMRFLDHENRWVVGITIHGKFIVKSFHIKKYGTKEKAFDAAYLYNKKLREQYGYYI